MTNQLELVSVTSWILELSFSKNFSDLFLDLRLDLILITSLDLKLEHISFQCSSGPNFQAFHMPFHGPISSKPPFYSSLIFLFPIKGIFLLFEICEATPIYI